MAARKEINPQIFIGVVVVLVAIIGYFLWTRSVTPDPTIPADQDIKHPFGGAKPAGSTEATGQQPVVPAPGTVDAQRGFGPSAGAAARMNNAAPHQ